jgi:hypothetical protein
LPPWLRFTLVLGLVLAAGLAAWAFATDSNRTRSGDMGSVRELSVVASNFQSWPDTAEQIARTNLFHAPEGGVADARGSTVALYHPEMGRLAVRYGAVAEVAPAPEEGGGDEGVAAARCEPSPERRCVEIVDGRMTVRGVALAEGDPRDPYQARAEAQQRVMPPGTRAIGYAVRGIPLEKVLTLPGSFEHVLIVEGAASGEARGEEGALPGLKVVAQIGRPELPIRSLNELPRLRDQTVDLAGLAASQLPDGGGQVEQLTRLLAESSKDALVPVDSRISGKAYRLYLYPVSISGTGKPIDFYVVGVKPASARLFDVDLAGAAALAFGFALALLLALTPVIKLGFLGPVDGIRRLELAGIIAGCLVAGAMAAAGGVLAWDVMRGRAQAAADMQAQAVRLAGAVHGELVRQVTRPMPLEARLLRPSARFADERGAIILDATADDGPLLSQPNTLFFLDGQGRQALDLPIVAMRDQPGADWVVADRGYFRRAIAGDHEAGSEALDAAGLTGGCREAARGFVVDQVRSRPDGVAKTVVATALTPMSAARYAALAGAEDDLAAVACEAAAARAAGAARVVVTSFVMTPMLRPAVAPGSGFAVVDTGSADLPVLFHSRQGRAHVEVLKAGLDGAAQAGLRRLPGASAAQCGKGPGEAITFNGTYNGASRLFAAVRVPCTRWAVVSFVDADVVDSQASRAVLHAIGMWLGLAFLASLGVLGLVLLGPARGWRKWDWLWPSEAGRALYGLAGRIGLAAAAAGLLLALWLPLAAALLAPLVAAGILAWISRRLPPADAPLSDETASRFRTLMLALLLLLSVVPVVGLAGDARGHFAGVSAAQRVAMERVRASEEKAALAAVVRVFREAWRDRPLPVAAETLGKKAPVPGGDTPLSLTAEFRRVALDLTEPAVPAPAGPRAFPEPLGLLLMVLLVAALTGLLVAAVRTVGRALFGFGVALEAVEHPTLRMRGAEVDLSAVRTSFMAIGAPSAVRESLLRQATLVVDLYAAAQTDEAAAGVELPPASHPPALVVLHDFELLLRNADTRTRALGIIEGLAEEQGKQPEAQRCRIGLLADMSPLDRFLASSEHREMTAESDREAIWASAEDIRWSRILEGFTNYVYRAAPRPVAAADGLDGQPAAIRLVVDELAYLPDHVVAAIIPDMTAGLSTAEIIQWASDKRLTERSEAAIIDYLASQLIEHYHYLWSVSSRAEQILIYRFAHGQLVNIAEAYALRSLVRRGIVVLDPVPRIVNRSFAQFVRHVEEPKRLARWQESQPEGVWTRLRAPLTFVLPLTLAFVLLLFALGSGSLATTVPFLLAAGPALLNLAGGLKRTLA